MTGICNVEIINADSDDFMIDGAVKIDVLIIIVN